MGKLRPFVRKDSYMPNKKWIPFVIGNGYTTTDGASGPAPEYETVTGNPVSFNAITPFPLRQLSVAFSPVQDLHGYDSPWPAGGGKNMFGFEEYLKANNAPYTKEGNTYTVTIADSSLFTNPWVFSETNVTITISCSAFTAGTATNPRIDIVNEAGNIGTNISPTTPVASTAGCKARINWSTPGTFTISEPMIELGSTKTAFVPYANICPISGWDSLNVEQTGRNLINDAIQDSHTNEVELPNGTYYAQAFLLESPSQHTTNPQLYINGSWTTINSLPYTGDGISITGNNFGWLYSNGKQTITITGGPIKIRYNRNNNAMKTRRLSLSTQELSEFVEYNPLSRSISITLGSTVYSGTVDVVTGVVTVTHGFTTIDGNSTVNPNGATAITSRFITAISGKANGASNFTSNLFYYAAVGDAVGIATGRASNNLIEFMLPTSVAQTANAGKAWFADNPTQVCYELATPIEIQLTPQEVESLAGDNVLFSDANGDLTVEYRSN